MTNLTIKINIENSAFQESNGNYEVARILRRLADNIEGFTIPSTLRDINGNKVGTVEVNWFYF